MQVSIETTSPLERRLTIGVPAARVEQEVNARLQRAAQTAKLDGFRPGKVPMKVIRQRFGDGVRQEVLGEVLSQSFSEAVRQEKLRPAGQPSIEPKTIEAGKDLEYTATFEVFPDIAPGDYSVIEVVKPIAEVTEQDVDKMIDTLCKQQGSWVDVARAAQTGDQVNIDYTGTKAGEAFAGGSAEGSDLVLGSARMIPGFEEGIAGMAPGTEKVVALSFPADYHNEDLKGAAVEFKIKLNRVQEQKLAELNDELFSKFGVKEGGVAQFRKEVAENMARELKNATRNKVKNQVMEGLLKVHSDLAVPSALVAEEIKALRNQTVQQFGGQRNDMDFTAILPDDMFRAQGERRVKLGLILNELINRDAVKADPQRVRTMIEEVASTYEDPQEVIDWYYSNRQQLQGIEAAVAEEQVVEKLLAGAKVSDKACGYEEALKADAGAAEAE
ncbi:MAG TPA: trigger factor [Spongiibacteraceae bacterium]|nr:trigger factor [Spongiibacteraceae bacterium]